jgi:hypothetical protein
MAATEFITARFPDREMPKTQTKREALQRVHGFIPAKTRARIREVGNKDGFGRWRSEKDTVGVLERRMDRMGVGPKLIVQRESNMDQLSIREVMFTPTVKDLGCNPHIEKSHALTYAEFGDLRSGGIWYCRRIEGSDSVSKHGYQTREWKGSAEDTFVTKGGMSYLEEVARWKVSKAKSGLLVLNTVIVNRTIYSAPSFAPRSYGGAQHYHIHEDAPGGFACQP